MSEFFAMGGYAAFVWPALAVTAAVMAGLYVQSHRALQSREAALETLQQARAAQDEADDHEA
jgi:heme exporter protein D